ncbi:MAG: nickel insertion protein, partial [Parahaliea sp.]
VSFHEWGEWDSMADLVGAAFLIEALAARGHVGPLPMGSGRVDTAHGLLPVPAPATALLLRGFSGVDDGIPGERVTPTGAAILRYLRADSPLPAQLGRLRQVGMGFGTRRLPGLSNVLRLLAYDSAGDSGDIERERISEISFEVDDQTPEDLGIAVEYLRALPGVRDVMQLSGIGKKGRLSVQLRLLVDPAHCDTVCEACFAQTTTIGLRLQTLERRLLSRRQLSAEVDGRSLRVKVSARAGGESAKAEADDVAAAAGQGADRLAREHYRRRAEQVAVSAEARGDREGDSV